MAVFLTEKEKKKYKIYKKGTRNVRKEQTEKNHFAKLCL